MKNEIKKPLADIITFAVKANEAINTGDKEKAEVFLCCIIDNVQELAKQLKNN